MNGSNDEKKQAVLERAIEKIKNTTDLDPIYPPVVVQQLINKSAATLWRWEKSGKIIPSIRKGGRCLGWRKSEIENWLKKSEDK